MRGLVLAYTGPEGPRQPSKCVHHAARADGRGLDLAYHFREVRSVVLGTFTRRCVAVGIEPDDLISTLYEAILKSNQGSAPYDPEKASVMRYIHLVAASRFSHMAEQARNRSVEQTGLTPSDGVERDAAEVADYLIEGTLAPDPHALIDRLMPDLISDAKYDDENDGLGAGSALAHLFADDTFLQGWREQAIRWVVYEAPDNAEVAAWWKCSVSEAARRMDWARARWEEELRRS
jgi:hypothetical protein